MHIIHYLPPNYSSGAFNFSFTGCNSLQLSHFLSPYIALTLCFPPPTLFHPSYQHKAGIQGALTW